MANSLGKFCICALALGASALAAQDRAKPADEIVLSTGGSFEIDNKTNLVKLHGPVRITQGAMSIEADEALATGTEFQAKSEWTFNGRVRITTDRAVMTSESAVFTFDD